MLTLEVSSHIPKDHEVPCHLILCPLCPCLNFVYSVCQGNSDLSHAHKHLVNINLSSSGTWWAWTAPCICLFAFQFLMAGYSLAEYYTLAECRWLLGRCSVFIHSRCLTNGNGRTVCTWQVFRDTWEVRPGKGKGLTKGILKSMLEFGSCPKAS